MSIPVIEGVESASSLYDIDSNVNITEIELTPEDITVTIEITFNMLKAVVEPTTYSVFWYRLLDDGSIDGNVGSTGTQTSTTRKFTIPGLSPNRKYKIELQASSSPLEYGNMRVIQYTTHSSAKDAAAMRANGVDPNSLTIGKSYLTISNSSADAKKKKYKCFYRKFDAITLPSEASVSSSTIHGGSPVLDEVYTTYPGNYYAFGTSLFLDPTADNPEQGAALGFFLNGNATKGYFIVIESTAYSASRSNKSLRIIKVGDSSGPRVLTDSQTTATTTYDSLGGTHYNVDIKVFIRGSKVIIKANVNGFTLTATDISQYSKNVFNVVLPPSETVGLVCTKGTAMFDYVYGTDITGEQYASDAYSPNFYSGQFSNDLINVAYGDIVYSANNADDEYAKKKTMVDEFGTTVREIAKSEIKYDSRPSYPVYWSSGANKSVSLLGTTQSNFNGSAYVLNNTSTTVPLSDGEMANFYMVGNTLADSGTLEYVTDELADYVVKEPVIFESKWLQNESDVKSIAKWIKDEVINRGQVITLTVFGNPLIALGDIVTISYPSQNLNGEEKFIVTEIRHSLTNGIDTTIVCRAINITSKEAVAGSTPVTSVDATSKVDPVVDIPTATAPANPFGLPYNSAILSPFNIIANGNTITWDMSENSTAVKIRILNGGVWLDYGTFTNGTCTFQGLTAGDYPIELYSLSSTAYGQYRSVVISYV